MSTFLQFVVEGLTIGSFYALVALGYTMVYGIIRLINFAHGDLFMVGAFVGWTALAALTAGRL
ncbi:MAG TPA: branched-chain amino acid ABC transporter permease, partial [Paraburkholderia sp.]